MLLIVLLAMDLDTSSKPENGYLLSKGLLICNKRTESGLLLPLLFCKSYCIIRVINGDLIGCCRLTNFKKALFLRSNYQSKTRLSHCFYT